ncbi:hypothetical protein [Phyllobacterium sophorae]|uniref:hypothetical protein n=1 Tax=Phyllobacterium sophorae TaxID=1520277 RepID=UPI0011B2366F|nr:hypothetical protein [Phyllobacterium sophorae]
MSSNRFLPKPKLAMRRERVGSLFYISRRDLNEDFISELGAKRRDLIEVEMHRDGISVFDNGDTEVRSV